MNAEIICVGNELLLGQVLNTNSYYISQRLAELGVEHFFQITVGDDQERLRDALIASLGRADIVITTGGLGPTVDDITTKVISEVTNRRLILRKKVLVEMTSYLQRMYKRTPPGSLRQAFLPSGSKCIKNWFGTAPGFIIKYRNKFIIALPGPPREMVPMMERYIIPFLRRKVKPRYVIKTKIIKIIGLPESQINHSIKKLFTLTGKTTLGIYAHLGEVELRITAKDKSEYKANIQIEKIRKKIYRRFGKRYIYGEDDETLEGIVGRFLSLRGKTVSFAESCTGGGLSDLVTNISGASEYFIESVIAYTNSSKIRRLGVPSELIKKYGAVSAEVAKAMARGIRITSGSNIGIGITGIAGPTGSTKTKPIGLVYIAISSGRKDFTGKFNFTGTRIEIKQQSIKAALNILRLYLLGYKDL